MVTEDRVLRFRPPRIAMGLLAVAALIHAVSAWQLHVPYEERKLRAQYGPDYELYRTRVRRWL